MNVLLVDEEPESRAALKAQLEAGRIRVEDTDSGLEALELAKSYDHYDCIVLEYGLKDMRGVDLIRALRAEVSTPIAVLSHLIGVEHTIKALNEGADHYLIRPFRTEELIARIHAIVRRANGHDHMLVEIGELSISLAAHRILYAGNKIHFARREWQVLEALILRRGMILSRETLLNRMGKDDANDERMVDSVIKNIRRKLKEGGMKDSPIRTEHGLGYYLESE